MTSFDTDIKPLFRSKDVKAMRVNGGFDLSRRDDVAQHATDIRDRLSAGTMPCDAAWPPERVALFSRWMNEGMRP